MNIDKHQREIYTKTGINIVFRIVGMLLGFVFVWLIIRWFGSTVLGKWALVLTILTIASVLLNLGINTSIVLLVAKARMQREPGRLRDAYLKSLVLVGTTGLLCGIGLYAFSDFLSQNVFSMPGLGNLLRIAAFGVLPLNILMLNSGALRGLRQITAHSFMESTGTPLFAIAILVVGYAALDFGNMFALAYVASLWLLAGLSFVLWAKFSGVIKSRLGHGNLGYRELLNISWPMLINNAMQLVQGRADIIMIGLFLNELDLAAYSLVMRLSALIIFPLISINSIAAPKFAEFHSVDDIAGISRIARQSTRIIFWMSSPVLLVLLVFSKSLLGIFGSDLTFGALALVIVALGQFFNAISGSVGPILNMTGHQHVMRNIILVTSPLNVILNYILIPSFGIEGAAIATSVTLVLNNVICAYYIKREHDFVPLYVPFLLK